MQNKLLSGKKVIFETEDINQFIIGQLKVFSADKSVNILCFKGGLLAGYYFCYGETVLQDYKTE